MSSEREWPVGDKRGGRLEGFHRGAFLLEEFICPQVDGNATAKQTPARNQTPGRREELGDRQGQVQGRHGHQRHKENYRRQQSARRGVG